MNVYFLKFLFKILVISMCNFSKIQEKSMIKELRKLDLNIYVISF